MRFEGTLTRWDDALGTGVVEPHQGGEALPVRTYDMRCGSQRPMIGEVWTFEVRLAPDGQKRAVNARRLADMGDTALSRRMAQEETQRSPSVRAPSVWPMRLTVASVLALLLIAFVTHLQKQGAKEPELPDPVAVPVVPATAEAAPDPAAPAAASEPRFRCDGRTQCSQMTSCEEATFFLKSCPGVQMDGNNDGVPCEQQWCTGG
jgi:hypothetical protein